MKRTIPILTIVMVAVIAVQAQPLTQDTVALPAAVVSPVEHCRLTDEKITRLSEFVSGIGVLLEDYYYFRKENARVKICDAFAVRDMFCVSQTDSDQVLNVVLLSEYNNLKVQADKVTSSRGLKFSLSNYLELRLQILHLQTLLLQGKTYFLVSTSGQQTIRNITFQVSTLREQLVEIDKKIDGFNKAVNPITVELTSITKKLEFVNNYDVILKQIYGRVDTLEKTTISYITQLQQFDLKAQFNEIKDTQQSTTIMLREVNDQVKSLQKGQRTNRLLIILAPIVTIAAIFIAK